MYFREHERKGENINGSREPIKKLSFNKSVSPWQCTYYAKFHVSSRSVRTFSIWTDLHYISNTAMMPPVHQKFGTHQPTSVLSLAL